MAYNRKPQNYVVEVHFINDVFSKDYGPEAGCAHRALERLAFSARAGTATFTELRLWHDGRCIMSKRHDQLLTEG